MFDWLTSLGSLKSLSLRVALIFLLFSGALLFIPNEALDYLGLRIQVALWRASLSIVFFFSICIIIADFILASQHQLKSLQESWRVKRHFIFQLKMLSDDEKSMLSEFIDGDLSTIVPALGSGTAGSLSAKKIIFQSSQIATYGSGFKYSIQPVALSLLRKYPKYLQLARKIDKH